MIDEEKLTTWMLQSARLQYDLLRMIRLLSDKLGKETERLSRTNAKLAEMWENEVGNFWRIDKSASSVEREDLNEVLKSLKTE